MDHRAAAAPALQQREICERYNVSRWQLDRTTNMILVAEDATAHIIPCCSGYRRPDMVAVVQIRGRFFVLGIEIDEHGHARYPPGADDERDQDNLLTWTAAEWWVLRISPFGKFTDSDANTHNPSFQQRLVLAIDQLEDMLDEAVYEAQPGASLQQGKKRRA